MKKIVITLLGIFLAISCSMAQMQHETKNYHSKKGFTHSHLTIERHSEDEIDIDLEMKGKDLDFEAQKVSENRYEGNGAVIEFLDNNEVRITINGETIEFMLLKTKGNGHTHNHSH